MPARRSSRLLAVLKTDDHIDAGDIHAFRRGRQAADHHIVAGNVHQRPVILEEEMMMVVDICVEIRTRRIHNHLAQEARTGELVQRIVDRGERDADASLLGFVMQRFGRDMPVAAIEKEPAKRQPLARRAEPCLAEP